MTYYQFIQAVETRVKEAVEDSVAVRVHTAEKNNGTVRKGITLAEKGSNLSPTIYLEEYYQQFMQGRSVEYVASDVLRLYREVRFRNVWNAEMIDSYETVKERIVYRLVNRRANREMLKDMPHIPYLDLAVVFCVLLEATRHGTATMTVHNAHLRQWGVTAEEIYGRAGENTQRLLPYEFQTMDAVIAELTMQTEWEEPEGQEEIMYVLSNRIRSHGAVAILYPGRLKAIGEYLRDSYYVLPSSIHEVIIIPERRSVGKEMLSSIVAEINRTQVEAEEVLSDCAYYYDASKDTLVM